MDLRALFASIGTAGIRGVVLLREAATTEFGLRNTPTSVRKSFGDIRHHRRRLAPRSVMRLQAAWNPVSFHSI